MAKAFLLDRDGTINVDTDYLMTPEGVRLIDGVGEAIYKLRTAGYLAIVISNQSGIARGFGTEQNVDMVNNQINTLLEEYNAKIDAFYYCPHHPEALVEQYKLDCNCRKPKTGLFERAIRDYKLEPNQCVAVGDKERDVKNVHKLGILESAVIGEGKMCQFRNLLECVDYYLKG